MAYPEVDPQPNFPRLEERILERWEADKTFVASILRREAEAPRSTSSTTARRSPTACRTTATC